MPSVRQGTPTRAALIASLPETISPGTRKLCLDAAVVPLQGQREALEALPGVGRKTANVILNIVFGEATIAVDTHIFRLGNRTGIAPGKDATAYTHASLEAGLYSYYGLGTPPGDGATATPLPLP